MSSEAKRVNFLQGYEVVQLPNREAREQALIADMRYLRRRSQRIHINALPPEVGEKYAGMTLISEAGESSDMFYSYLGSHDYSLTIVETDDFTFRTIEKNGKVKVIRSKRKEGLLIKTVEDGELREVSGEEKDELIGVFYDGFELAKPEAPISSSARILQIGQAVLHNILPLHN